MSMVFSRLLLRDCQAGTVSSVQNSAENASVENLGPAGDGRTWRHGHCRR